jgi:adhesin HecA-like repeat protein
MGMAGTWMGWLLYEAIQSTAPPERPAPLPIAAAPAPPTTPPVPAPSPTAKGPTRPLVQPDKAGHLEGPDAECRLGPLKDTRTTLTGRIGLLVVDAIDNATLDATGLDAREVLVHGNIDHGSIVVLRAPGGCIGVEGKVDGDSKVSLTARQVDLRGSVRGARTTVTVRLTGGGTLRFKELAGEAQLAYWKNADGGPSPTVEGGIIREGAQLLLKKE